MNPNEPDNSKRPPRTRDASLPSLRASVRDISDQLREDGYEGREESDPLIVVRDSRTDHMAKNPRHKIVKRKTCKKKYRESLRKMKDWIRSARPWPLKMILSSLRSRLQGYWNYYGVKGSSRMTGRYFHEVTQLMFKWLNRRSQRKSYTWAQFGALWSGSWQVPRPRVPASWRK